MPSSSPSRSRPRSTAALLALVLLSVVGLPAAAAAADQQPWDPHTTGIATTTVAGDQARERAIAAELVAKANDERAARGVPPVQVHPDLEAAAAAWAQLEAAAGDQTHAPFTGVVADGWVGGENLNYARGFGVDGTDHTSAQSLHTTWMGSAGHRNNMLWVDWTHVGVAVVCDAAGGAWVVARFGRPDDGRATTDPATYPTPPAPQVHTGRDGGPSCAASRGGVEVDRAAGVGRYETAATLSRMAFPATDNPLGPGTVARTSQSGSQTVLVASGQSYADALSAAAAASSVGAPLVLTDRDRVPAAAAAELDRIDPDRIVVVGGTAAVSAGVAATLARWAPVERLAGTDRAATSRAVVSRMWAGRADLAAQAYVVDADDWPAAMVAATNGPYPVVATTSGMDDATVAVLRQVGVRHVVLVGTIARDADVVSAATERFGPPTQVDASDPTGLSVAFTGTLPARDATLIASTGSFADALAAAAMAWRTGSGLLLADPTCPSGAADRRIANHVATTGGVVTLLGGEAATPACVAAHL